MMESASCTGPVHYRTAAVGGVSVFYREAGPGSGPVVLLLHGFPSSSRMFRDLIPRLSDAYHVIAPDYPAFGHSAVPGRPALGYTCSGRQGSRDRRANAGLPGTDRATRITA
jgi:pimeloyl-ACP methyl ester carboxylesterase